MTQDEIIRMAIDAGFETEDWANGTHVIVYDSGREIDITNELEHFAAIVAAHEREACAKVCEDMGNTEANMNKTWRNGCSDAAEAIRSRNEK